MKKIYEFVKEHNVITVNQVALEFSIPGKDALSKIEQLRVAGFLKMISPVPLSTNNDESCYYTITNKEYNEN